MFDAQREAQHVGINARSDQFAFVELGVRRRSGVYQEAPGVAHVGQVADDLQVVEQRGGLFGRSFDAEGQYAAETVGQILLGQIVERTALQTGVVYALDLGVLLEPLSHFECIVHRSLYAQREGFESLQQQEGVERTLAGARVAEHFAPCPYGESLVAAVFPEVESVIPFRGFADQGVAAVAPIEVAAVDSHAAHAVAVTSDPFGRCVQHDIGAPFDRLAKVAAGSERIVGDYRDAVFAADFGDRLEIGDIEGRVADRFDVDGPRTVVDECRDALWVVPLCETDLDAESAERVFELVGRSAVEVGGAYDIIACLGDVRDGEHLGGHARCRCNGSGTSFEGGDALFENGGRGVVQAGVDVPRFREGENGGALFRTFEGVGHRLVDGDGARSGRWIGLLACMYLQGFETEILFFHGFES